MSIEHATVGWVSRPRAVRVAGVECSEGRAASPQLQLYWGLALLVTPHYARPQPPDEFVSEGVVGIIPLSRVKEGAVSNSGDWFTFC